MGQHCDYLKAQGCVLRAFFMADTFYIAYYFYIGADLKSLLY